MPFLSQIHHQPWPSQYFDVRGLRILPLRQMPHVGIVIMAIGSYQNTKIPLVGRSLNNWSCDLKTNVLFLLRKVSGLHIRETTIPIWPYLCRALHCCFKTVHMYTYTMSTVQCMEAVNHDTGYRLDWNPWNILQLRPPPITLISPLERCSPYQLSSSLH